MPNGYPTNNVYIGARYVPKLVGEWDSTKETAYEPLIIVTYQGNSYTSRQYVPAGIDISNTEYWVLTGNFNGQIESFRLALEAVGNRANTIYMDTVQDMMESTRLKAGDIVTCFGYYQLGDMPQLSYIITEGGIAPDGGSLISLANGESAKAIIDTYVIPEWFGIRAKNSNSAAENPKWDALIKFAESNGKYIKLLQHMYTIYKTIYTSAIIQGATSNDTYYDPYDSKTVYPDAAVSGFKADSPFTFVHDGHNSINAVVYVNCVKNNAPQYMRMQDFGGFSIDANNVADCGLYLDYLNSMMVKNLVIGNAKKIEIGIYFVWFAALENIRTISQYSDYGVRWWGEGSACTTTTINLLHDVVVANLPEHICFSIEVPQAAIVIDNIAADGHNLTVAPKYFFHAFSGSVELRNPHWEYVATGTEQLESAIFTEYAKIFISNMAMHGTNKSYKTLFTTYAGAISGNITLTEANVETLIKIISDPKNPGTYIYSQFNINTPGEFQNKIVFNSDAKITYNIWLNTLRGIYRGEGINQTSIAPLTKL